MTAAATSPPTATRRPPAVANVDPFAQYMAEAWPHEYRGTLSIKTVAGGVPFDPNVAQGWINTKLEDTDDILRDMVAKTMVERGLSKEDATKEVDRLKHLNGFKRERCPNCPPGEFYCSEGLHELYVEGRQLKSAIKEAVSCAVAAGKIEARGWGRTKKHVISFAAEHIMVMDERLLLGVYKESGIIQRFVHTFRGDAIQYEEYCEDVSVNFTIRTDHKFDERTWAMIWLTGEQQGIGASRSQGLGRYKVTRWEKVPVS